jgi:hypothetical protein
VIIPRSPTSTTRDPDSLAELLDLGRQRLGIPHVALEDLDGDRAALPVREKLEDDLQFVPLALARVTELCQGALPALEVRRGDIVKDDAAGGQMLARQGLPDAPLLREQPVHRFVEFVFVGGRDIEALTERGLPRLGRQRARGRELGAGVQQARGHHGLDEIPLPETLRRQERGQAHLPRRAHDCRDVAVLRQNLIPLG